MSGRSHTADVVRIALGAIALVLIGATPRKDSSKAAPAPLIVIPAPTTRPVVSQPDAEAQAKALKLVKEAFGDAYQAKAPAERRSLARKLLQQGIETADNPAARFVLLRDARDIAASAGDVTTAVSATTHLEQSFKVEGAQLLLGAITIAQRHADSPAAHAAATHAALIGTERAVATEDFPLAMQFMTVAKAGAARSQQVGLVAQVQNRESELQALQGEQQRIQSAREAIRSAPNDPAACAVMGKYLCLSRGDWAAGLPLLARCNDEALRTLATSDLASARDAAKRTEAANGWWEMARTRTGLSRKHLRDRAALHYRRMIEDARGISQTIAAQRLAEAEIEAMRELNFSPGLFAELFKGNDFNQPPLRTRIDPQINFDWQDDPPDEALARDHFAIRWSGILKPPVAGRYELTVVANMGVCIRIGGQTVCDEPDLSRKRNGIKISLDMPLALHPIVVEYQDKTGKAEIQLKWTRPGATSEEPIPPSAFFHDMNLQRAAEGL